MGAGRGDRQMAGAAAPDPGGQAHYSDMAIEPALMLWQTFHLPLRQTEGFMQSIFALLGVTVSAPDHSTLSRRDDVAVNFPRADAGWAPARTDRQHGIESVRRGRMAAGKAWRAHAEAGANCISPLTPPAA